MDERWLFLDMNAFFASVEQQENPSLRGKPIIVVPMEVDSTCAIAASYEAKAFGIRTGTMVGEAKRLCPGIILVKAGTSRYRDYHHRIVEVLRDHFATIRVLSVDEMACRLSPLLPWSEEEAGRRIKQDIVQRIGECMRCSVGIAPNVFLAKVTSDLQKPDGLSIVHSRDLPGPLTRLELQDFPGIGRKMLPRLYRHGIYTVEQMYAATPKQLATAWGGVTGLRWHQMIRGGRQVDYGDNIYDERKSVGHSHVLPPEFRNRLGVSAILIRLLSKGLKRLRRYGQVAAHLHVSVRYRDRTTDSRFTWQRNLKCPSLTADDLTWIAMLRHEIETLPHDEPNVFPYMAAIGFSDLCLCANVTPSLFENSDLLSRRQRLSLTVDKINERFPMAVDVASAFWLGSHAPDRIAFGTGLLSKESAV